MLKLRRLGVVGLPRLRRTQPVSASWGFDRGTPVDRVHRALLERHAADVRGRVLEMEEPEYTTAYGGTRVTAFDVLDIDPANEHATVVADLNEAGSLPPERFDCAIVTQTLQYMRNPETAALTNLWHARARWHGARHRSLHRGSTPTRPTPTGGASPRPRHAVPPLAGDWSEVEVQGFGNVLTSVAFLMGLAAEELRGRELDEQDPSFPLVACARARKSS